jgi:hypothetical protein
MARVFQGLAGMRPRPKLGFGGRVFNLKPALRETTPGIFLGETLAEGLVKVRLVVGA